MALQFVPGYRDTVAGNRNQPELAMPGLIEELKKKLNRPVPELPLAEDTDNSQQDAPTCPNCGHVAVRNGACYKCLNCGESLGCS